MNVAIESLVGKKVRIRAIKPEGSARILDGLTATAVCSHPFAVNWVMIDLDPNPITPHRRWSIAVDRLVLCETENEQPVRTLSNRAARAPSAPRP
jgi:hypothetical protein